MRRGSERLYSAERAGIGTAGGVCGRHTCVHGGWLAADRPGPWQVVVAADVGYLSDMWRLPLHQNRSSFVTVSHSICSGARKPLPLACRRPFPPPVAALSLPAVDLSLPFPVSFHGRPLPFHGPSLPAAGNRLPARDRSPLRLCWCRHPWLDGLVRRQLHDLRCRGLVLRGGRTSSRPSSSGHPSGPNRLRVLLHQQQTQVGPTFRGNHPSVLHRATLGATLCGRIRYPATTRTPAAASRAAACAATACATT